MMQSSSAIAFSPSFSSYSSGTLADIAARVIQEFRAESVSQNDYDVDDDDGMFDFQQEDDESFMTDNQARIEEMKPGKEADVDDDEDEFEFAFVCRDSDSSPIPADEIFYNGQIKPVFPLFDTSLLLEDGTDHVAGSENSKPPVRLSLRKLFNIEERDCPSCSSSEAEDLDGALPGSYCVWRPKSPPEESPDICKKSHSTGNSSKRWKFKDLLHRSLSDGRDTVVFLTPSGSKKRTAKKVDKVDEKPKGEVGNGVSVVTEEARKSMTNNAKESERRRSYLPYKPDLVGLFANVSGLSRNIHPF